MDGTGDGRFAIVKPVDPDDRAAVSIRIMIPKEAGRERAPDRRPFE